MSEDVKSMLIMLGRKIGKYTDCDIFPDSGLLVYGFEPDAKCKIPAGDTFFDLGSGVATPHIEGKQENPASGMDILEAISNCDKATAEEMKAADEVADEDDDGGHDFDA